MAWVGDLWIGEMRECDKLYVWITEAYFDTFDGGGTAPIVAAGTVPGSIKVGDIVVAKRFPKFAPQADIEAAKETLMDIARLRVKERA